MTISELLQASREAHARYRDAVPHRVKDGSTTVVVQGDAVAAGEALVEACQSRAEAYVRDPDRRDLAWLDDGQTHDHDALLNFYLEQLTRG